MTQILGLAMIILAILISIWAIKGVMDEIRKAIQLMLEAMEDKNIQ